MLTVRYSPGKIWANFVLALVAGIVIVCVLGALWDRSVLLGGFAGLAAVAIMLIFGCVKRSAMREPILIVDGRGITIGLPKFGTIAWSAIRSAEIKGLPWVTSARLVIETSRPLPKATFGEKLNWLIQTKHNKDGSARLSIAAIELTDQPLPSLKAAIAARGV